MRLVSDKSLWVLNYLELCHLLLKDWCLLPAMILRLYCKVLHWNLWPHLSGTMRFSFLQDNLLRRQGVQVKTRYPPNLDKTHRKHIMNFLKESGWVATWWRLRFFFSVVSRLRTPSYVNWCVKCNIKIIRKGGTTSSVNNYRLFIKKAKRTFNDIFLGIKL